MTLVHHSVLESSLDASFEGDNNGVMPFLRSIPTQVTDLARRLQARHELRRELASLSPAEAEDLLAISADLADPELRRHLLQARWHEQKSPFHAA